MGYNILLYGATGYSGRLIAAEGKVMNMSGAHGGEKYQMILAARDLKKSPRGFEEVLDAISLLRIGKSCSAETAN